jgi:hypothetical protein
MTPKIHRSITPLLLLGVLCASVVQSHAHASKWKGMGVSTGAPLPPTENFKPRALGPELAKAGLKPEVIAKLDVEMQWHVAAKSVAGIFENQLEHPTVKYGLGGTVNGDCKLTRDELPAVRSDRLDADNDWLVSEAELGALSQR